VQGVAVVTYQWPFSTKTGDMVLVQAPATISSDGWNLPKTTTIGWLAGTTWVPNYEDSNTNDAATRLKVCLTAMGTYNDHSDNAVNASLHSILTKAQIVCLTLPPLLCHSDA